ncbi:hypothetical protein [Flavobacterium sp. I3-2]|uniref:hypothetical protein n=1 Tax=Flavobacterium sp. I3-2 TaxID=2748319 RepID=UPI0015AEB384|nr:hypothetical protein [Flavobacterium sp. I3-2]
MKKILSILLLIFSLNSYSQFKSLYEYEFSNNDELDTIKLKIDQKIFELSEKSLRSNDQIIYEFKQEDVSHERIYDNKYLFVFLFSKKLSIQSFGLEVLKLNKLYVIDLDNPKNKWFFDLSNLEKDYNLRLGIQSIKGFNAKEGKLYFSFNFTYNEKSQIEGL